MGFFSKIFGKKDKKEKKCECGCEDKKAAPAATPRAAAAAPAAKGQYPADAPHAGFAPELLGKTPEGGKIKIAIYWCAGCGGCDVSILDSDEMS